VRVLVLAPQIPWPPHQGTTLRNFNIVRQIARRHQVTVVGFGDPGGPYAPLADLGVAVVAVPPPPRRSVATRLGELLTTCAPDLSRRLASRAMDARLASIARGEMGAFEVVQIEGLEMAAHGLAVHAALRRRDPRVRLIYDAHNAEWVLQHRAWRADLGRPRGWPGAAYSAVQTWKLRRFERRVLRAADGVVAVSAADEAALRDLGPLGPVALVPNGVDTELYRPANPELVDPALCVFTGKMDFRPNVDAMAWFRQAVWPRVRQARSDARLAIVGRDPSARVVALADPGMGVEVTGAVPDVQPWLARAGVVVVPLRVGGGTRLKVLEAMAMGKAIAATSLGVEGLDLAPGREVVVADDPAALARGVADLMSDADLRRRLGERARARAVADYRWEALVPAIERLYDRP